MLKRSYTVGEIKSWVGATCCIESVSEQGAKDTKCDLPRYIPFNPAHDRPAGSQYANVTHSRDRNILVVIKITDDVTSPFSFCSVSFDIALLVQFIAQNRGFNPPNSHSAVSTSGGEQVIRSPARRCPCDGCYRERCRVTISLVRGWPCGSFPSGTGWGRV